MKIFVTGVIPDRGIRMLREHNYEVFINPADRSLRKEELIEFLKNGRYDAVLCLLNDKINSEVFDAAGPQCKIFANYAVGFDNIDLKSAAEKGIMVSNTPDVLTDTVAEHTFALMLSIAHRIVEGDKFIRDGKFHGWEPSLLLGSDISGKTLGVVGLGRIGSRVAYHAAKGFAMKVLYYDVKRNEEFEKTYGAEFSANIDDIFQKADFISIHVPLTPETRHLVDARRLGLMKKTAYLINTSRGPMVDEAALVEALRRETIRGAALDVFEHEPDLASGLADLPNVVLTPHLASASEETRQAMSELAAKNIIDALEGRMPQNLVKT